MKGLRFMIAGLTAFLAIASAGHAEIYKYIDKNGTPCFVDSLTAIPERYRSEAVLVEDRAGHKVNQPVRREEIKNEAPPKEVKLEQPKAQARTPGERRPGELLSRRYAVAAVAVPVYVLLFVLLGKLRVLARFKWAVPVLRLILSLVLAVGLLQFYAPEARILYDMFREVKEDILGQ